jgi:hypothetical protein
MVEMAIIAITKTITTIIITPTMTIIPTMTITPTITITPTMTIIPTMITMNQRIKNQIDHII